MIERLHYKKNLIDLIDFFNKVPDKFEDCFITVGREREFLKGNWVLIEKILKKQQCYGLFASDLKAVLIIVKDKGFPRSYVKLLAQNSKFTIDLLKYLKWNYLGQTLFFKLKKTNPLSTMIIKTGFYKVGDRGLECLFEKKAMKQLYPITSKDNYLIDKEKNLY